MTSWKKLTTTVERMQTVNSTKKACVGFDGYIDSLYRVVRSRESLEAYSSYETISDFASHLSMAAGRSGDMELIKLSRRMGGNAPLMAEALSCLKVPTQCIGAMGYPELDDVFSARHAHFAAHSVGTSAKTIAFEFDDGKLMFGDVAPLHEISWASICGVLGLERVRNLYRACDLWGIVNWSFLIHSNDIISGFLTDVVEGCLSEENRNKILFFDLADPAGRSRKDVRELCTLLKRLAKHCRVVLGLNENEALRLADILSVDSTQESGLLANALRETIGIGMVTIHGLDWAAGADQTAIAREESLLAVHPAISTGGGDNFNAGLCAALLNGLPLADTLAFANMVSSYYVSQGHSVTLDALAEYAVHC